MIHLPLTIRCHNFKVWLYKGRWKKPATMLAKAMTKSEVQAYSKTSQRLST